MTGSAEEKAARKALLWAHKMELARMLAWMYGVKIRITCNTWHLSDGAVVREYVAERTGLKLWAKR